MIIKLENQILKLAKRVIKETVKRNITESDIMLSQCIKTYLKLVLDKDFYSVDIKPPKGLHDTHRLDVTFRINNGTKELKMRV